MRKKKKSRTSNAMGNRSGTGVVTKGRERVTEILNVATDILVKQGYGEFTMRKIAEGAKMQLGNLQYYFPAKRDLLQSLLQCAFDRYEVDITRHVKNSSTPIDRFNAAMNFLLKDQKSQLSSGIFWELWALASHDPDIAKVMDGFYKEYCKGIAKLLQELNPALSRQRSRQLAVLVVSMIEGISLMRGYGKPRHTYLRGIEKELRTAILRIAKEG